MRKRIAVLSLLILVLFNFGCVDTSVVNKNVIEKAEDVYFNHKAELKQIIPICDQLFLDKCNVYYILTSPTTDLYAQGVWIDDLYYEDCIVEPTQSQVNEITKLLPRPKIDDIYYLKGVFTSFGLSYLSKENDALLLVHIEDLNKFQKVYNLAQYNSKNDAKITNHWMKNLDDHWYVCSADLVHDGSKRVCDILK